MCSSTGGKCLSSSCLAPLASALLLLSQSVSVTLSGKSSLILGENKAAFRRERQIVFFFSPASFSFPLTSYMVSPIFILLTEPPFTPPPPRPPSPTSLQPFPPPPRGPCPPLQAGINNHSKYILGRGPAAPQ